MSFWIGESPQR